MRDRITLDSWAVLAWLQGEPAGTAIRDMLHWTEGDEEAGQRTRQVLGDDLRQPKLFMNIINLGEVFYLIGRRKGKPEAQETITEIRASPIEIVSASDELVLEAAALKIKYPMAYADAFAVATAVVQQSKLITGDPGLRAIEEAPILWLGEL